MTAQAPATSSLDEHEQFFRAHFADLARAKNWSGAEGTVFAIEHGLEPVSIQAIARRLSDEIPRNGVLDDRHWLCWVVHATEVGYGFSGHEFWQTFALRKPRWDIQAHPKILRSWFQRFANEYRGVKPDGRWSSHFSYISWPVTHALLPKDFQSRLARAVYDARYSFARVTTPESLGKLVEQQDDRSSSRFTLFLKHHELVGRILLSLLGIDSEQSAAIYPQTLRRITADLTERTYTAEWMQEARRALRPVAGQFVGGRQQPRPAGRESDLSERASQLSPTTFMMRPAGNGAWTPTFAPPSLLPLCAEDLTTRSQIEHVYFRIPCNPDRSYKGSMLLQTRPRDCDLKRWPSSRENLLVPETPLQAYALAIDADLRFDSSDAWAFRIDSSGVGVHIRSGHLRAGDSYLLAAREANSLTGLGARVRVDCPGVHVAKIDIPALVSVDLQERLRQLGLQVRRTLRIQPIGMVPRRWTDEGYSEWLNTERPCFVVQQDYEADSVAITLDDEPTVEIVRPSQDNVTIQFPSMGVGLHTATIQTFKSSTRKGVTTKEVVANCRMTLLVRAPSTWTPFSGSHQHLVVDVTPVDPCVEDVLSGSIRVGIAGGSGRRVRADLHLLSSSGEVLSSIRILEAPLPLLRSHWESGLEAHLLQCSDVELGNACGGRIALQCDDLGTLNVRLATRSEPLRWHLSKDQHSLQLINDGIDVDQIYVVRYPFESPLTEEPLELSRCLQGIDLRQMSGQFKVMHAGEAQSIVAGDQRNVRHQFHELGAPIDLASMRSVVDPQTLWQRSKEWRSARAPSWLARSWRSQVLSAIDRQFEYSICGHKWWTAEKAYLNSRNEGAWSRLETSTTVANFGIILGKKLIGLTQTESDLIAILKSVAASYRWAASAERAWQVAKGLQVLTREQLPSRLEIGDNNFIALVQGARLLTLAHQRQTRGG